MHYQWCLWHKVSVKISIKISWQIWKPQADFHLIVTSLRIMPQWQQDQAEDNSDFESSSHADEHSTDSCTDSDEDLVQVCTAIAPARDGATVQEVCQVCLFVVGVIFHCSHTFRCSKLHRTCSWICVANVKNYWNEMHFSKILQLKDVGGTWLPKILHSPPKKIPYRLTGVNILWHTVYGSMLKFFPCMRLLTLNSLAVSASCHHSQ